MSARRPIYIKREWQRIREVEAHAARECAEKYGISPRNNRASAGITAYIVLTERAKEIR